jgi:hypothetical protein
VYRPHERVLLLDDTVSFVPGTSSRPERTFHVELPRAGSVE